MADETLQDEATALAVMDYLRTIRADERFDELDGRHSARRRSLLSELAGKVASEYGLEPRELMIATARMMDRRLADEIEAAAAPSL